MQISFNHIQKNCKTIKDIQKLEISYAEASASVSYPLGETKELLIHFYLNLLRGSGGVENERFIKRRMG